MSDNTYQDPAAIEHDIRQTQEEMSRTVDAIGDQLTPRNILNALLDKAESNDVDARMVLDGARRNPLALAMMAGGAIWLVSDNDAKLPGSRSRGAAANTVDSPDLHHRDYISHMERVEMRDGESSLDYQRRRDAARANYFMVERGHDEDDHSFQKKLDEAAEAFRSRRRAWAHTTRQAGDAALGRSREAVGSAVRKSQDLYDSNPLIGGLIAAAAGAILGNLLPETEAEQRALGEIGQKARSSASEQVDHAVNAVREMKNDLIDAAEEHASPETSASEHVETQRA